MEILIVGFEKIVDCTIGAAARRMGYLIHYKKNVDNLRNEVVDLEDARDDVQRKVQAARDNLEEIEAGVQTWLKCVQGITAEVQKFFEEEDRAKLKCFILKARYQIGKKAHKMGLAVKGLKYDADMFYTVGHRVPIRGVTKISTKGFEDFESRKSIFDGVMKALKDDNIRVIGVCGMGGSGKTMLVGKIATQANEFKLFERIVTVVVSEIPDLKQFQKDVAKELELMFQDEDADFQKAHLLRERLKKEKILLIIDDIWNKLDLEAVGISFGDDHKGSKLLLTSRFQGVLGMYVDAQEMIFSVGVLSDDEAKYLFLKIVGDIDENLNFQSVMVEIVKECGGLPIAITTVANALKERKNLEAWKNALQRLKMANALQRLKMANPTPIKAYVDFESRKSIFDGVMEALKDDNIPAIGVCGMGGLGKTMLVGKIATQAIEDKLFERIVTVVVSQTPNLKQIQKDIAKELGLEFKVEDTDFQKAHLLRERLNKEKILLIIDDIWNELDLEALGISFGDDHKGSKLLLTSRFQDVLGMYVDAQGIIFSVGVLLGDEAKYLFSKIVGDLNENWNFQSVMVELVKECDGLPIAITTVANALKSHKTPIVWMDALRQLKRANPTQIKGMHEKVYWTIKLSYNFLSEEARSLFLFCSIFEEDMSIPIASLCRYFVGLDFFEDVYKMEEVRNRVHALVESLKDASLLLEGDGSGTFKMHDVTRDVAIFIANKEQKMLTIRSSGDLEKWSNMKNLKDPVGIALSDVELSDLPKRLECPQLNFIFLDFKDNSSPIPNHFFEGAKELKVLVLSGACFSLPSSHSCLQNLQSLVLYECELEDVAIIGELKNLRALTLSESNIKHLPIEIGQLTHLQLLDLERCTKLEVIPPNVLSNLISLEELYMKRSFNQWQVDGESTEGNNARVSELDHLSLLTTLYIHIPNAKILPKAFLFEKLKRYEILIGNDWDWDSDSDDEFEISRMVKLKLERSFQVEDGIKILLKRCEYLDLAPREGIKNIISEVDKEGFPKLKHLYVRNSTEIQYIINLMGAQRVVFPLLEFLSLDNMINLEKICHDHDQLAMGSFHSLKKLEVSNCDGLILVFPSAILGCFSQLQEIVIKNCNSVEEVFDIRGENVDEICDTVFTQLRVLRISNLPKLKHVWNLDPQAVFTFQNLHEVSVSNCKSLKSLFPV